MRRSAGFLAVLIIAGFAAAASQSDETVVEGKLGRRLDKAVTRAGGSDYWGAVLVARDGKILLAKGYGRADYKKAPNTPNTLFELASASKQVTAAAILHLAQKKKLKLTDTLDRFFKDIPADKKSVQVHHLLTHTAGLSGKIGVPYASRIGRKDYVRSMLRTPLVAKPGEKFTTPAGYGKKLIASLEQAIAARVADDDGSPARTEAGLYLQPYPRSSGRISLDKKLTLDIRPEYRGREADGTAVVDRRVLIVLMDGKYGQWPLMAKLNVAAARSLLAVIRNAMN